MDHAPFRRIKPCGYAGLETTDLAMLAGHERVRLSDVRPELLAQLLRNLGYYGQKEP
jgi:lipoyl(octanoyl) transferase